MKKFIITEELANGIYQYLANKPFIEVEQLIKWLRESLIPYEEKVWVEDTIEE